MMPFAGGIENLSNGALVLSGVAALYYLVLLFQPQSWRRSVIKTAAVALLAVVTASQNGPGLLLVALVLSAAGDFFLSREGEPFFLAGLSSFLAAHVAFIALFYGLGGGVAALLEPWRATVAFLVAAFTFGVLNILMRRVPANLRLPVATYSMAILAMGLAALTMENAWVIAGALMFMASDTLLAWERFVMIGFSQQRRPMQVAVWVLYYAAQVLIVLGFVLLRL